MDLKRKAGGDQRERKRREETTNWANSACFTLQHSVSQSLDRAFPQRSLLTGSSKETLTRPPLTITAVSFAHDNITATEREIRQIRRQLLFTVCDVLAK